MARSTHRFDVYLEIGKKRTFAGALDWPGWCRSGRDEASALQALIDYGSRYAHVLRRTRLGFQRPEDVAELVVRERLTGNATTDFGAPGLAASDDVRAVDARELQRLERILRACWRTLDRAVDTATGKELRRGPRGGGRPLEGILQHVMEADEGYLTQLGRKLELSNTENQAKRLKITRQAILEALAASARGEIPARGPRGGLRWSARYFVRRFAWHTLDHVWEIEDRVLSK